MLGIFLAVLVALTSHAQIEIPRVSLHTLPKPQAWFTRAVQDLIKADQSILFCFRRNMGHRQQHPAHSSFKFYGMIDSDGRLDLDHDLLFKRSSENWVRLSHKYRKADMCLRQRLVLNTFPVPDYPTPVTIELQF